MLTKGGAKLYLYSKNFVDLLTNNNELSSLEILKTPQIFKVLKYMT